MEQKQKMADGIIARFDEYIGRKLKNEKGISLFKGDGFMDLVVNILPEEDGRQIISMGHYFEHEGMAYPDPCIHFRMDRKSGEIKPLLFRNTMSVTRSGIGKSMESKAQADLLNFLYLWLNNIMMQGFGLVETSLRWERQEQETEGDYSFDGTILMTTGYKSLLSPFEMFAMAMDLQAFILHKESVDYLQVYVNKETGQKIFCIDELSLADKKSKEYTHGTLKDANRHTYLLAEEY
jgi:hypothetical protein